jgi:hypothetical protein
MSLDGNGFARRAIARVGSREQASADGAQQLGVSFTA